MAKAPWLNKSGAGVDLDAAAFGAKFNEGLVHETARAEQNARRRGTAATRTRAQVRGGGVKPWRQKGTGRARAGSIRSPIWTGGGIVFGPSPRSYTVKVNRKARRAALRSVLSVHADRGSIAVLDSAAFEAPSTKQAASALAKWDAAAPALIVLTDEEEAAAKSFRNIDRISVLPAGAVGVLDVIAAASLVVSEGALEQLTALATGEVTHQPKTAPEAA
ncbi:MAG: large subunit ribosomal protein [Solirubrobacteraceae bacterium]|jgi:large subunit ribosomal protein L4|nr:large subunit ribosomal protein [Solirubrobacteraceae bacterium]